MAEAVVMPRQGQSVETCVITQWLKKKGDQVEEGDLLFSYETDKAAFDENAPVAGTLLEVLYEEGDEVPVLQTVAIIGKPDEDIAALLAGASAGETTEAGKEAPGEASEAERKAPAGQNVAEGEGAAAKQGEASEAERKAPAGQNVATRISPRARNMAEAMQVDIASVRGSGPNGRIIANDIQAAAGSHSQEVTPGKADAGSLSQEVTPGKVPSTGSEKTATAKGAAARPAPTYATPGESYTDHPLSNIRKIIATNMKASLDNSAQLTHHSGADARKILALRKEIKEGTEQRLPPSTTLNDMVCHAIIQALKETPDINAHFLGEKTRTFSGVHLGMAVDTPRGLMVPVLKNADRYTLGGLGQSLRELAESCKNGSIDPDLLAPGAGSFTVSNLGAFGVEMFTPVLNLPQCGIIGINTITHRPADIGDGSIGFIPHIGISLTYDHRAIDGAPASRFLQNVCKKIAGFTPTF